MLLNCIVILCMMRWQWRLSFHLCSLSFSRKYTLQFTYIIHMYRKWRGAYPTTQFFLLPQRFWRKERKRKEISDEAVNFDVFSNFVQFFHENCNFSSPIGVFFLKLLFFLSFSGNFELAQQIWFTHFINDSFRLEFRYWWIAHRGNIGDRKFGEEKIRWEHCVRGWGIFTLFYIRSPIERKKWQ